jgi:hypothetical protein
MWTGAMSGLRPKRGSSKVRAKDISETINHCTGAMLVQWEEKAKKERREKKRKRVRGC